MLKTEIEKLGTPKPSGPLPNRGITAPANIDKGMPQKSGLLGHLAKIAKARVTRGDSTINQVD